MSPSPDRYFDHAVEVVLLHEGGFVDDPDDPGGATNFGVSLRWLRSADAKVGRFDYDRDGDLDEDDVRAMTREEARDVYREFFWRPEYRDLRPYAVAAKTFDLAVNMGPKSAHRILQRSCRAFGERLEDDGVLGPMTLSAIARINGKSDGLVYAFRAEAAGWYRALVAGTPRFSKFLRGWLNRAYS